MTKENKKKLVGAILGGLNLLGFTIVGACFDAPLKWLLLGMDYLLFLILGWAFFRCSKCKEQMCIFVTKSSMCTDCCEEIAPYEKSIRAMPLRFYGGTSSVLTVVAALFSFFVRSLNYFHWVMAIFPLKGKSNSKRNIIIDLYCILFFALPLVLLFGFSKSSHDTAIFILFLGIVGVWFGY